MNTNTAAGSRHALPKMESEEDGSISFKNPEQAKARIARVCELIPGDRMVSILVLAYEFKISPDLIRKAAHATGVFNCDGIQTANLTDRFSGMRLVDAVSVLLFAYAEECEVGNIRKARIR